MIPILALDPGLHQGWALWNGWKITSGVQDFSLKRGESRGMIWLRLDAWLREMNVNAQYAETPIKIIAWEQPHHRGGAATEIAYGMTTRYSELAAYIDAETQPVHSATLKKWATGSGRASKDDMRRAALKRWDRLFESDDECDAYCVCRFVMAQVGEDERADVVDEAPD